MRGVLKYILPIIFAAILWGGTDRPETVLPEVNAEDETACAVVCQSFITDTNDYWGLLQHISLSKTKTLRRIARKNGGSHHHSFAHALQYKTNISYIKRYFHIQDDIVNRPYLLAATDWLLFLCTLVI